MSFGDDTLDPSNYRFECASCHKAPADDPTTTLRRVNKKGIPGVFLCQYCFACPLPLSCGVR